MATICWPTVRQPWYTIDHTILQKSDQFIFSNELTIRKADLLTEHLRIPQISLIQKWKPFYDGNWKTGEPTIHSFCFDPYVLLVLISRLAQAIAKASSLYAKSWIWIAVWHASSTSIHMSTIKTGSDGASFCDRLADKAVVIVLFHTKWYWEGEQVKWKNR